jgi:hypothetical protein
MLVRFVAGLAIALWLGACVNDYEAVIRTAANAQVPWHCPVELTRVDQEGAGRLRLSGCDQSAVYACNFAIQPPRCFWLAP